MAKRIRSKPTSYSDLIAEAPKVADAARPIEDIRERYANGIAATAIGAISVERPIRDRTGEIVMPQVFPSPAKASAYRFTPDELVINRAGLAKAREALGEPGPRMSA